MWRKARFRWDNQNCKKTHISPLVTSSRLRSKPNVNAHNAQDSTLLSVAGTTTSYLDKFATVVLCVRCLRSLHDKPQWTCTSCYVCPLPPQPTHANLHEPATVVSQAVASTSFTGKHAWVVYILPTRADDPYYVSYVPWFWCVKSQDTVVGWRTTLVVTEMTHLCRC